MFRITPESVVAAYKKTGITPTLRSTSVTKDGKPHSCALGALYAAEIGNPEGVSFHEAIRLVAKKTDNTVEPVYSQGFVDGFDNEATFKLAVPSEGYKAGHEDGVATRLLVEKEFGSILTIS